MHEVLIKIGVPVAALLITFAAGWQVQGWRLEGQAATLRAEQTQAQLQAAALVRSKERQYQADVDKAKADKDAEVQAITNKLRSALDELRQRKARPAVVLPQDSGTNADCTGKELYRQDAEFLIGEAARADQIVAELKVCISAYDAVKN